MSEPLLNKKPELIYSMAVNRTYYYSIILMTLLNNAAYCQWQGLEKLKDPDLSIPEILQYNPGLVAFFQIENIQASYMNGIAQHLVKNRNGLFLLPDGTGRVYKIEWENTQPKIRRQDSTVFFGYNFGFYPFSFHDSLYSFGGYGYWKFNGHLRVFVPKKGEWELENLNREIPFTRVGYTAAPKWYDMRKGELWIGFSIDSNEGVQKHDSDYKNITDSVYLLDLNRKEWKVLGPLQPALKNLASSLSSRNLGSSPWGQLIFDPVKFKIYLIDYPENKISILNPDDTKLITRLLESESILYFQDSTLFIGLKSRPLDSVNLSKHKFITSENQVYIPVKRNDFGQIGSYFSVIKVIGGTMSGLALAGFFYYYIKRNQNAKRKFVFFASSHDEMPQNLFNEKEIELLNLIVINSSKGFGTSIEAINRILGVSHKNFEIQKKQRSDVLISINRKWRYKNSSKDLLISKKRVEPDKRSFVYFIDFQNLNKLYAQKK